MEIADYILEQASSESLTLIAAQPLDFQTHFAGCMEMYSDAGTVAEYLAAHEGWFCRCAEPMRTEPLAENGYTLTIGRYGAFGYEVEPKMGVVLEQPVSGVYEMHSVAIAGEKYPGYEVDYRASMRLQELPAGRAARGMEKVYRQEGITQLPEVITQVAWELHLKVAVQFPQFIYKLPSSLIAKTGDRILTEIVRQVSPRLTLKVQRDFHQRHNLPLPPKGARKFQQIDLQVEQVA
jgi:hypothetical protein